MQQRYLPTTAVRCIRRSAEAPDPRLTACAARCFLRLALLTTLALFPALYVFSNTARAQTEEPQSRTLTLQEALAKALEHNKELAAFGYRLEEQEGRVQQAGLLPNPQLNLLIEDAAGSGIYNGLDSAQTTLSLEWVLEQRLRRRRVDAAQARSALLISDAEILRLDVAAETALKFLSSLANQAQMRSAGEAVALAEDTVIAVKRRVRVGKAPSAELTRAEAEFAIARLAQDDVAHDLSSAYHRLAAQWGEREPTFSQVNGDLLTLPTTPSFASLTARIEQNPRIARFLSEERLAKASQHLAETQRWPTLRPTVGIRRYEATDDVALVAELKFPLPLFDRNQGQISASRAALARTRADAEAARVRVHTTLFESYQELQRHLHRANTLRDIIVPGLTKALEEARLGYEQGRYSYFEWGSVQADLLEARSALVEASAGAHRLVISLERLTGVPVAQPGGA